MKTLLYAAAGLALAVILAGCSGGAGGDPTTRSAPSPAFPPTIPGSQGATLSLAAQVGKQIFFDRGMSGSGKMACATCHDPNDAYGPPNNLAVQLGGTDLTKSGTRAVPSLRYKEFTPAYSDQLTNPDGVSTASPGGGFTWDGRANTLADQAQIPLLAANEMANASAADVVAKLQKAAYASLFMQAFGNSVFGNTDTAFRDALQALQAFQLEDPSFHPYTSKYDLHASNKIGGDFTAAEARGMQVFNDPNRGNCAACHYPGPGYNGSSGLFTDFTYANIGVPRNMAIPANQDASYDDMGICGPARIDHLPAAAGAPDTYCGLFKVPTLRNVATRSVFFHNGVMHSLEQVIRFYNTRDTMPEIWYPTVGGTPQATPDPGFPTYGLVTTQYTGGTVQKFNDLPDAYLSNIDRQMPLDGRAPGSVNPMSEQDIADLVCFLKTLTDGYQAPAQPPASGQCVS